MPTHERYRPRHAAPRALPPGDMRIIVSSVLSIALAATVLFAVPATDPADAPSPSVIVPAPCKTVKLAAPNAAAPYLVPVHGEHGISIREIVLDTGRAPAGQAGTDADDNAVNAGTATDTNTETATETSGIATANPWYSDAVPLSAELQAVLYEACTVRNIPYHVALGLIDVESDFDENALNPESLCYGLCQINPEYWPADLSPADNIRQGMKILRIYLDQEGQDMDVALTCYHGGHDYGSRDYADAVMSDADKWAAVIGM